MKNKENLIEKQAFELFVQGVPMQEIATRINKHRITLYKWADKFNWWDKRTQRLKQIEQENEERFKQVARELVSGSRMIYGSYFTKVKKDLEEGQDPRITSKDAVNFAKIAKDLVAPKIININQNKDILSPMDILSVFQEDYDDNDDESTEQDSDSEAQEGSKEQGN